MHGKRSLLWVLVAACTILIGSLPASAFSGLEVVDEIMPNRPDPLLIGALWQQSGAQGTIESGTVPDDYVVLILENIGHYEVSGTVTWYNESGGVEGEESFVISPRTHKRIFSFTSVDATDPDPTKTGYFTIESTYTATGQPAYSLKVNMAAQVLNTATTVMGEEIKVFPGPNVEEGKTRIAYLQNKTIDSVDETYTYTRLVNVSSRPQSGHLKMLDGEGTLLEDITFTLEPGKTSSYFSGTLGSDVGIAYGQQKIELDEQPGDLKAQILAVSYIVKSSNSALYRVDFTKYTNMKLSEGVVRSTYYQAGNSDFTLMSLKNPIPRPYRDSNNKLTGDATDITDVTLTVSGQNWWPNRWRGATLDVGGVSYTVIASGKEWVLVEDEATALDSHSNTATYDLYFSDLAAAVAARTVRVMATAHPTIQATSTSATRSGDVVTIPPGEYDEGDYDDFWVGAEVYIKDNDNEEYWGRVTASKTSPDKTFTVFPSIPSSIDEDENTLFYTLHGTMPLELQVSGSSGLDYGASRVRISAGTEANFRRWINGTIYIEQGSQGNYEPYHIVYATDEGLAIPRLVLYLDEDPTPFGSPFNYYVVKTNPRKPVAIPPGGTARVFVVKTGHPTADPDENSASTVTESEVLRIPVGGQLFPFGDSKYNGDLQFSPDLGIVDLSVEPATALSPEHEVFLYGAVVIPSTAAAFQTAFTQKTNSSYLEMETGDTPPDPEYDPHSYVPMIIPGQTSIDLSRLSLEHYTSTVAPTIQFNYVDEDDNGLGAVRADYGTWSSVVVNGGGTSTTFTDSNRIAGNNNQWTADKLIDRFLLDPYAELSTTALIVDNTTNTIVVAGDYTDTVDNVDSFQIIDPDGNVVGGGEWNSSVEVSFASGQTTFTTTGTPWGTDDQIGNRLIPNVEMKEVPVITDNTTNSITVEGRYHVVGNGIAGTQYMVYQSNSFELTPNSRNNYTESIPSAWQDSYEDTSYYLPSFTYYTDASFYFVYASEALLPDHLGTDLAIIIPDQAALVEIYLGDLLVGIIEGRKRDPLHYPAVDGYNAYIASGQFKVQSTDLGTIPGRGLNLSFSRTYSNQRRQMGPLGPNWTHSYHQKVEVIRAADEDENPVDRVLVHTGTDQVLQFEFNWDDTTNSKRYYGGKEGIYDEIVETYDGNKEPTQIEWRSKSRLITTFGPAGVNDKEFYKQSAKHWIGWMTKMEDRNGNEMNFIYNQTTGLLETIRMPCTTEP